MGCSRKRLGASALALAVFALAPSTTAADRCANCHARLPDPRLSAPAKQLQDSVHGDDLIGCSGCHGGDNSDPTVRSHADESFNPKPKRDQIPELCGGCHANATFVRRLNASLQVDQLDLYRTSVHGIRLREGDQQVAVCTSCHGVHDIVSARDPRSHVYPSNLPTTCAKCHSDAKRMARYGIPTDQFALWKESVHGQANEKGNFAAPTCKDCHGSHGATPPAVDSVGRVCGRCHSDQLRRFRESPHARPFAKLGFPECEQCHGNHAVQRTVLSNVGLGAESVCGKCHTEGQKAGATVKALAKMIGEAGDDARAAREAVRAGESAALPLHDARLALSEVHTAELHVSNALHSFDESKLRAARQEVSVASARARSLTDQAWRVRAERRRGYLVVAGLFLVHLILLVIKILRTPLPKSREET